MTEGVNDFVLIHDNDIMRIILYLQYFVSLNLCTKSELFDGVFHKDRMRKFFN